MNGSERAQRLLTLCCRTREQLRRGIIDYAEWERRGRVYSRAYNAAAYPTREPSSLLDFASNLTRAHAAAVREGIA